jgi:hypothetical protein
VRLSFPILTELSLWSHFPYPMASRMSRQMVRLWLTKQPSSVRMMSGYGDHGPAFGDNLPLKVDIGKREIVGFGVNGDENYIDDVHFPFPAIRFNEDTAEISVRRRTIFG